MHTLVAEGGFVFSAAFAPKDADGKLILVTQAVGAGPESANVVKPKNPAFAVDVEEDERLDEGDSYYAVTSSSGIKVEAFEYMVDHSLKVSVISPAEQIITVTFYVWDETKPGVDANPGRYFRGRRSNADSRDCTGREVAQYFSEDHGQHDVCQRGCNTAVYLVTNHRSTKGLRPPWCKLRRPFFLYVMPDRTGLV